MSQLQSRYGSAAVRAEQRPPDPEVMTVAQVAAMLQVHPVTVSLWLAANKFVQPVELAGSQKAIRFLRSDVVAWLEQSRRKPKPAAEGRRMMQLRGKAGVRERVQADNFEHGIEVEASPEAVARAKRVQ